MQERSMDAVRAINGCEAESTDWAKSGTLIGTRVPVEDRNPLRVASSPLVRINSQGGAALIVKFFQENALA